MRVNTSPRMALTALLVAAGCSGGGSSAPPPPVDPPSRLPPDVPFTLHGTVNYVFPPVTYDPATGEGTLAFPGMIRPVRGAKLQVRQGTAGTLLAETQTSETGAYTITFTPGERGELTVAALAETVTPSIRVEDNTDGNAVWAVGALITDSRTTIDVQASTGWDPSFGYDPARRIAAPFAILDSMYTAARRFLDIPRSVPFPALRVNWSPDNRPEGGNKALGQITTSHYSPSEGEIYILGKEGVDTDEFDSHVIVHEWAHYFEDKLSRSDSPGGPHGPGDVLDPRLAFGEGYGNALAAMLLPESIYADTMWSGPDIVVGVGFDAEKVPTPTDDGAPAPYGNLNPGPFSEMSILRVLYDLYDDSVVPEAHDTVALGLGPIYDTLVGPQKSTDSFTTIASFVTGLKAQPGVDAPTRAAIDAVLAERSIGPIADQWGAGDGDLAAMFPNAAPLPFSGGVTLDGGYDPNKWQAKQYWVVTGTGAQITVTATSTSDVALEAYRNGIRVAFADSFPENQTETVRFGSVNGAKYVVVLTGLEPAAVSYGVNVSVTTSP